MTACASRTFTYEVKVCDVRRLPCRIFKSLAFVLDKQEKPMEAFRALVKASKCLPDDVTILHDVTAFHDVLLHESRKGEIDFSEELAALARCQAILRDHA
jgi:hypothetical protein